MSDQSQKSIVIKGSCCCKAIQFELIEIPNMMGTCHCSRCRKVGASTLVFVKKDSFRWISGQDFVSRYEPEVNYKYIRCFCKQCGTALGEIMSNEDSFPIAANTLDSDPIVRNMFHEFISEKPEWYSICDTAPQFPGHPTQG